MQIQSQPERNKPRALGAPPGAAFAYTAGGGYASPPPLGMAPRMSGEDARPEKPESRPGNGAQKAAPQDSFQHEQRQGGHGNASTWMSLYKFCGPLVAGIGYGTIFGSHMGFAALVSLVVSSLQAGTALKIHKEDTPWAKNIVRHTRKLMGRENDHSAAGKEWSMVPVWGAVCGLAGLTEASINHGFARWFPPQTIEQLRGKEGRFKRLYHMQAEAMQRAKDLKDYLTKFLTGPKFKRFIPRFAEDWPAMLKRLFGNKVQGNAKLGYLAGIGIAGIGGMLQSASAAKIQERLDAKHAEKAQGRPDEKKSEKRAKDKAGADNDPQAMADKNGKPLKNSDEAGIKPEKPAIANPAEARNATEKQKPEAQKIDEQKPEAQKQPVAGKAPYNFATSPEKVPVWPFPWSQPATAPLTAPVNALRPDSSSMNEMPPAPWGTMNSLPQAPFSFRAWPVAPPAMPAPLLTVAAPAFRA